MCLIVSYFIAPKLIDLIKETASQKNIDLNIFKVTESVSIYAKTMLIQGICYSLPFFIIQLYIFIKPSLNILMKKTVIVLAPVVSILFLVGIIIGYYLLSPLLFTFFVGVTEKLDINTVYDFSDYFQFIFMICLLTGLILEIPAIMFFLAKIELISISQMKAMRKFIYPLFCIVSVIITPPDFISDLTGIVLLISIFEIGLLIIRISIKHESPHFEMKEVNKSV